jgi:hypothetical protein
MNHPTIPTFENQRASGQDILLPAKTAKQRGRRSVLLELNTRDRNAKSYPNANSFRWKLFRPLKDVVSIQIVGGTIPTRIFNIDAGWNQFTFREGSTRYTVTLSPGRYFLSTLSIEIGAKLNILSGISNTYSVAVSPTSDTLHITRDTGAVPFALLFGTGDFVDLYDNNNSLIMLNSPAKLFGFLNQDYTDNAGLITGPNAMDLEFLLSRLYLYMNSDNSQEITMIERSVGRRAPYTIIYMDMNEQTYKTFTRETFEPTFTASPAPIARMTTLDISFRDEFDRLVNFNGRDVTLLIEFVYLE